MEISKARFELLKLSIYPQTVKQFLVNPSTRLRSISINLPTIFGTCLSYFITKILLLLLKRNMSRLKTCLLQSCCFCCC